MKKIYAGSRDRMGEVRVTVFDIDTEKNVPLEKRIYPLPHLVFHSPTGMEWGYGGSGPADLALSILRDHFGEQPTAKELRQGYFEIPDSILMQAETAEDLADAVDRSRVQCWQFHQFFKQAFVSKWGPSWQISTPEIEEFLQGLREKTARM